ncbi:nuclear transport factor 2 family protein [Pseudofrankia sp. BMG5.36]|uniref:nuclear transport factor 2 family protein n=1 Tax=Pseudofrankia sp. BMG5.36 TaxID=1834512 RepID=UPI0008DA99B3|nr:nuclear transport factor 2 family protein [Pseudofrankia sp. BMG5.36]OHV46703.1 hypothetical protein BCD48_20705 [Pseudofrankia sp. BMG5.36]
MPEQVSPDVARLLERLDVLESKLAVEELMAAYMEAADLPTGKGEAVARLFAEDGRWESVGPHGNRGWAAVGRAALVPKFDRNVARMPFAAHFLAKGKVQVSGDTARGQWTYFQACTYRDNTPLWIAGSYDNDFTRVDGQWLIAHLRVRNFFTTPFDKGWVAVEHMDTP